jgi:EF hand
MPIMSGKKHHARVLVSQAAFSCNRPLCNLKDYRMTHELPSMKNKKTRAKKHFIPNFEMHSVLLMGTLVMALAATAHAQSVAPGAENRNSPALQVSPPAGTPPTRPAVQDNASAIAPNKVTASDVDAAFNRADANKDGKLDRTEAAQFPAVGQRFDQIDTNKDGYISRQELKTMTGS